MTLSAVLAEARFWLRWAGSPFNDRQIDVLVKSGAGGRSTCYDLKPLD